MRDICIIEDCICSNALIKNAGVHERSGLICTNLIALILSGRLQLIVKSTVENAPLAASYPTEVGARCASFMRAMPAVQKIFIVVLESLIGCAPLSCHNALMIDKKLADPRADSDYIKEDYNEDDPFRPSK